MALQYAFRLCALAFAVTLIRAAFEKTSFTGGLQDSFCVGLIFLGIGFAVGEISRHIVEELAEREFSLTRLPAETGVMDAKSKAETKGS